MKLFTFILLFCLAGTLFCTALGDLAASMNAGEWRELSTNNINAALLNTGGASGFVFGYTEDIKWDSNSEALLYVGSDHFYGSGGYPRHVTYAASTNTWREESRPSWFPYCVSGAMHGYDNNAIDTENGILFHHKSASRSVYKCDINSGSWSKLPDLSSSVRGGHGTAIEYFPEMNGIIRAYSGSVHYFNITRNSWSLLHSNVPMGGYHNFAAYNPVHKVMVLGGGNGSNKINKVDATGKLTPLADAPNNVGVQWGSIFTVDPVSGDYLVFFSSRTFYSYNVVADTWTRQTGTIPAGFWSTASSDSPLHGMVGTPVSSYGVNLFLSCTRSSARVFVYKHSESSAIIRESLNGHDEPVVRISPNPFHSRTTVTLPFADTKGQISIYDLSGKLVKKIEALNSGHVAVDRGNLTNGIYLLRVRNNNKTYVKRLLIQK